MADLVIRSLSLTSLNAEPARVRETSRAYRFQKPQGLSGYPLGELGDQTNSVYQYAAPRIPVLRKGEEI